MDARYAPLMDEVLGIFDAEESGAIRSNGSQAAAKISEGSIPEHSVRCCLCHDVPRARRAS